MRPRMDRRVVIVAVPSAQDRRVAVAVAVDERTDPDDEGPGEGGLIDDGEPDGRGCSVERVDREEARAKDREARDREPLPGEGARERFAERRTDARGDDADPGDERR